MNVFNLLSSPEVVSIAISLSIRAWVTLLLVGDKDICDRLF